MASHENIVSALNGVQSDLTKVGKEGRSQGYAYRKVDDLMKALHPLLAEHGVVIAPVVLSHETADTDYGKGGWTMTTLHIRYEVRHANQSSPEDMISIVSVGQGLDSGDKGVGKAFSYAFKSAMSQLFSIPTDDPEMDNEFTPAPERVAAPKKRRPPVPTEPVGPTDSHGRLITLERLTKGFLSLSPEGTVEAVEAFQAAGLPAVTDLSPGGFQQAYELLGPIVERDKARDY